MTRVQAVLRRLDREVRPDEVLVAAPVAQGLLHGQAVFTVFGTFPYDAKPVLIAPLAVVGREFFRRKIGQKSQPKSS